MAGLVRRALVIAAVAALTWALSTVRHDDARVVAAVAVLVEVFVLVRLGGRALSTALASGAFAGGAALLVVHYVRAVFGPAYPQVATFVATPWLAVIAVIAFGLVTLADVRRPASSAPSASSPSA